MVWDELQSQMEGLSWPFVIVILVGLKDIASDVEGEEVEGNCETALAEATRTSYIKGRWVSQDEATNLEYSIIGATLPGSGNYSLYLNWGRAQL